MGGEAMRYRESWSSLRGKGVVSILVGASVLLAWSTHSFFDAFALFWLSCWMTGGAYALHPCPRCDRPFTHNSARRRPWNPLTRRCQHCGLRRGEDPPRVSKISLSGTQDERPHVF